MMMMEEQQPEQPQPTTQTAQPPAQPPAQLPTEQPTTPVSPRKFSWKRVILILIVLLVVGGGVYAIWAYQNNYFPFQKLTPPPAEDQTQKPEEEPKPEITYYVAPAEPTDFPKPTVASLTRSLQGYSREGEEVLSFSYDVGTAHSDSIIPFFKTALPQNGWQIDKETDTRDAVPAAFDAKWEVELSKGERFGVLDVGEPGDYVLTLRRKVVDFDPDHYLTLPSDFPQVLIPDKAVTQQVLTGKSDGKKLASVTMRSETIGPETYREVIMAAGWEGLGGMPPVMEDFSKGDFFVQDSWSSDGDTVDVSFWPLGGPY